MPLPDDWMEIDCSPLEAAGFSQSHLIQIYREYTKNSDSALSTEIIQDSINQLAFDLKYNDVEKSFRHPSAVVLMSILKKGKPYTSTTPGRYRTPQEEAMHQYLAQKEQRKKEQEEILSKIKDLEFQEWFDSRTQQELSELAGTDLRMLKNPTIQERVVKAKAQEHWENEVWPEKKGQVLEEVCKKA